MPRCGTVQESATGSGSARARRYQSWRATGAGRPWHTPAQQRRSHSGCGEAQERRADHQGSCVPAGTDATAKPWRLSLGASRPTLAAVWPFPSATHLWTHPLWAGSSASQPAPAPFSAIGVRRRGDGPWPHPDLPGLTAPSALNASHAALAAGGTARRCLTRPQRPPNRRRSKLIRRSATASRKPKLMAGVGSRDATGAKREVSWRFGSPQ